VSGADLALIVAEPTAAGVHDMQRALQTTKHFGVRTLVGINKADVYLEGAVQIEAFCQDEDIPVVGRIPFDTTVTEAMVQGQAVTAYRPEAAASRSLEEIWREVIAYLEIVA
jgi:MinD superfamily P-loop ATPase